MDSEKPRWETTGQPSYGQGAYVAIEGIDGSGKTTVAKLVNNMLALEGYNTALVREPFNEELRSVLSSNPNLDPIVEAYVFATDRVLLHLTILKALLEKRDIVISDRSYITSLVYQVVRGAPLELVESLNKYCLKPDVVYLLDVPVETAARRLERKKKRHLLHLESRELLGKLRERYLKIAEERPEHIRVVDATRKPDEVASEIALDVERMLSRTKNTLKG